MSAFTQAVGRAIERRVDAQRDRGATAVEYSILVGGIAAVIIGTVMALGLQVEGLFNAPLDELARVALYSPTW